tara:strand:+ start:1432 stop:2313 length:882 start_codon:yes stop_codon:yes gene_type:complete
MEVDWKFVLIVLLSLLSFSLSITLVILTFTKKKCKKTLSIPVTTPVLFGKSNLLLFNIIDGSNLGSTKMLTHKLTNLNLESGSTLNVLTTGVKDTTPNNSICCPPSLNTETCAPVTNLQDGVYCYFWRQVSENEVSTLETEKNQKQENYNSLISACESSGKTNLQCEQTYSDEFLELLSLKQSLKVLKNASTILIPGAQVPHNNGIVQNNSIISSNEWFVTNFELTEQQPIEIMKLSYSTNASGTWRYVYGHGSEDEVVITGSISDGIMEINSKSGPGSDKIAIHIETTLFEL